MDKDAKPNVFMSNSFDLLFERLKQNFSNMPSDPFYKKELIVSDIHSKTLLQLELAKALGVLFGLKVKTIQDVVGASYLTIYAEAIEQSEAARALYVNEKACSGWYQTEREPEQDGVQELHLFCVSALSYELNNYFFAKSKTCTVYYYVLTPCMHFWSDVCSDQEAKKLTKHLPIKQKKALREYLDDRSSLLANNGTRSREFIAYLQERLDDYEELYSVKRWMVEDPFYSQYVRHDVVGAVADGPVSLFDSLHADLLFVAKQPRMFSQGDTSVEIHKAPTLLREVEALYQYIQKIASKVSSRIVVFAPDIERYRPYIKSLFANSAEIVPNIQHELMDSFLEIIGFVYTRLKPKKLFELFQNRSFRKKSGIDGDDLAVIAAVLDRFDLSEESLKKEVVLSWIGHDENKLQLATSEFVALGHFLATVDRLYSHIKALSEEKTRPVKAWQKLFIEILECYFLPSDELYTIKKAFINAAKVNVPSINLEQAVALSRAAYKELQEKRESPCLKPIIFATLGDVRSLPCDAVCFLGMNEGAFPRTSTDLQRTLGFLHGFKKPHTVRAIDRHLVIEALLLAKSMLYISYQSYAFTERTLLEPATIVVEIMEALGTQVVPVEHTLESSQLALSSNVLPKGDAVLQEVPALHQEVITLRELARTAKYPIRAYMQEGLGLYLNEYKPKVARNEFEALTIKDVAIAKRQAFTLPPDRVADFVEQEYRQLPTSLKMAASSLLSTDLHAHSQNAKILGITQEEPYEIELTLAAKKPMQTGVRSWKIPPLSFDIDGKKLLLVGRLLHCYPEGLVTFETKTKAAVYAAWPEILLVNLLQDMLPIKPQLLFIREAKSEMVSVACPHEALKNYIAYVLEAKHKPSGLYPSVIDSLSFTKLADVKDPYLELYLSRTSAEELEEQAAVWKEQAALLFGGIHEL